MGAAAFFKARGMTSVAGRTYPGTFAIATVKNFNGEQVDNRDSASWKKAEHIVIEHIQEDAGRSILPRWRMLTAADPGGLSIQRLYVAVGNARYAMYSALGDCMGIGTLADLISMEV